MTASRASSPIHRMSSSASCYRTVSTCRWFRQMRSASSRHSSRCVASCSTRSGSRAASRRRSWRTTSAPRFSPIRSSDCARASCTRRSQRTYALAAHSAAIRLPARRAVDARQLARGDQAAPGRRRPPGRQLYPHRFILADEVGLGKTIEAGLLIRELRARGVAQRVLILAPSGLVGQWQQELKTKFNLTFAQYTSDSVRFLVSEHPDENVWTLRGLGDRVDVVCVVG